MCQKMKGRLLYNGKPTRNIDRENSASPTATNESINITCCIDAHKNRDIMSADTPNAFVQTELPKRHGNEDRVIMKITGVLVDMMVKLNPQLYGNFVVTEENRKVIYVIVLKGIIWNAYGVLILV